MVADFAGRFHAALTLLHVLPRAPRTSNESSLEDQDVFGFALSECQYAGAAERPGEKITTLRSRTKSI
jgi:hypothetical protein